MYVGAILIARDIEIKISWQNEYVGAILIARKIEIKLFQKSLKNIQMEI